MMASIEDEAAEAAELMARRGSHSVVRNGHEFERRMSKVSRKSARSSVGGGSNNGSYQGALGTTTAEVIPGVQTSFENWSIFQVRWSLVRLLPNRNGQTLVHNACKNGPILNLLRHPVATKAVIFVHCTVFETHQLCLIWIFNIVKCVIWWDFITRFSNNV